MNKLFLRISTVFIAFTLLISVTFAEVSSENKLLAKEQSLVNGVESKSDSVNDDSTFWGRMKSMYEGNAPKKLEKIPRDIGEEEGFWTRIKKAFAYNPVPQKDSSGRELKINVLMINGRQFYRDGEYQKALETFKNVIQLDPYNVTARRYIKSSQESLNKITLDDFDIIRRERLQDVEKAWLLKPRQEREIEDVQVEAGLASKDVIQQNIKQVIPSIQFVDAQLGDVFEHLFQISNPKVSIITKQEMLNTLAEEKKDTITLNLTKVPFIDVIKYICNSKGLNYRVDEDAVVISGKDSIALRTKIFQLSRSLDMIELPDVEGGATKKVQELFKRIGVSDVEGAKVTYQTRNNKLIVVNTDANLQIIEEFLNRYGETPAQVQIEARFVTVQSDDMNQLVFRHFLTKNYRWNRGKNGDKFNLEAPNKEREVTPGLRYIRSFMKGNSFNPVASAYDVPSISATGNEYDQYLQNSILRPQQVAYNDTTIADVNDLYSSIEQQKGLVNSDRRTAQDNYRAYKNFLVASQPIIAQGGPNAGLYAQQLDDLYYKYQNSMYGNLERDQDGNAPIQSPVAKIETDDDVSQSGYLTQLSQLENLREQYNNSRYQNKVVDDGLGKIFDIQGVIGPAQWRSVVYALDNNEGIHTIFAPKVTVMNGQRAEIKDVIKLRYNKTIEEAEDQDIDVGDLYAVTYDYAVTPKEWDTREYGTRLIVTPSVQSDDKTIELDVNPEVSSLLMFRQFVSSRNNDYSLPQFFVQSVKTTVSINDGDTLVMGGLMRDELIKTEDKVPIVGDLPLIGRFFRSKSEVERKSNLMIFITAKIIDPSGRSKRRTTASL